MEYLICLDRIKVFVELLDLVAFERMTMEWSWSTEFRLAESELRKKKISGYTNNNMDTTSANHLRHTSKRS